MGCTSKWYEKIELRTGFKNVHNFSKLELSFIQGKTVLSTMSVIYANDNFLREKKSSRPATRTGAYCSALHGAAPYPFPIGF